LTASAIEGVNCAIHLAHDFKGIDGARLTLKETLANISRLRAAGIKRQIFFSSYSAGEYATSIYGRTKLAIEIGLAAADDIVIIRPGLVLGDGGIYGRILKWVKLPLIPLPDGGYGRVPVIEVVHLCRATVRIAEATAPAREYNLFERQPLTLRQLVLDAAAEAGRKPWIVPVPASLMAFGLRIAAAMRFQLPVDADNLAGFMANQVAEHIPMPPDSI
jgi:uncharacterized protein YbjT (DUF2867 family)